MEQARGARIGPYEILEELGRGGFGSVYRARDAASGRHVALKVLREEPEDGALPARRFLRETALARELDHPGILRALDSSREDERPLWVAFELVEGVPLWRLLAEEPLDWRRAAEIARDVAAALGYAHSRGVLHRDVKPGNILIGRKTGGNRSAERDVGGSRAERGDRGEVGSERSERTAESAEPPPAQSEPAVTGLSEVTARRPQVAETAPVGAYLSDFGLARLTDTRSRLTITGVAVGTPEYMSPEQAQGETTGLTPATDVWSLGVVLYEMLAGRPPFEGNSPESVIEKVVLREPVRLRRRRPDAPAGLARVVRACLAKRPRSRYPHGTALAEDLDRVLRGRRPRAPGAGRWAARAAAAGLASLAALVIAFSPVRLSPSPAPAALPPSSTGETLASRARAVRASDPAEAARLLRRALEEDPGHPDADRWRLERGLLLWCVGDGASAREGWSRIPPGSPCRPAAQLYRGLEGVLRLEGGRPRAREDLADLEAAGGAEGRVARVARGALAVFAERWAEARGLLAGERGWEASVLRGYLEGRDPAGDRAASVREFGEALADGVPFSWAYNNRGGARLELGEPEAAIRDFDAALRLAPSDPRALSNRGIARVRVGDGRGAIEDFSACLRSLPGDFIGHHQRGLARHQLGDHAGALEDLTAALRARPRDPEARYHRGNVLVAQGDIAAAERDFTAAIEARPDFAAAITNRGNVRWNLGDEAGAFEDYDAAIRLEPRSAHALNNRGRLRLRHGRLDDAEADLRAARLADPEFPDPRFNLGILHQKRAEWGEAVRELSEFLRMAPDHKAAEEARRRLAECEEELRGEAPRPR